MGCFVGGNMSSEKFDLEKWIDTEKEFVGHGGDFGAGLRRGAEVGYLKAQEQLAQRDREIADAAWKASFDVVSHDDGDHWQDETFADYWASLKKEPNDK